jgi:hypothetical protein
MVPPPDGSNVTDADKSLQAGFSAVAAKIVPS